jgi:hypothetical protein
MNALRGNTYLERLELWWIDDRQVTQALAATLHGNKGLLHLAVYFHPLDDSDRTELLKAISLNPSLRLSTCVVWGMMQRRSEISPRQLQICCQSTNELR